MLFRTNTIPSGEHSSSHLFGMEIISNINFKNLYTWSKCFAEQDISFEENNGILWSEIFSSLIVWAFCWEGDF